MAIIFFHALKFFRTGEKLLGANHLVIGCWIETGTFPPQPLFQKIGL